MAETAYIVLRRTSKARSPIDAAATTGGNGNEQWEVVGTLTAASADAAVRKIAEKQAAANTDGPFVLTAVPARSWKPVQVRAEQTVTLKLEEAK